MDHPAGKRTARYYTYSFLQTAFDTMCELVEASTLPEKQDVLEELQSSWERTLDALPKKERHGIQGSALQAPVIQNGSQEPPLDSELHHPQPRSRND